MHEACTDRERRVHRSEADIVGWKGKNPDGVVVGVVVWIISFFLIKKPHGNIIISKFVK